MKPEAPRIAQCGRYYVQADHLRVGSVDYRFSLFGPNYGGAVVRLSRYLTLNDALKTLPRYAKGGTIELFAPALEAD